MSQKSTLATQSILSQTFLPLTRFQDDFKEQDPPRGEDGKFTSGGGGGSSKKADSKSSTSSGGKITSQDTLVDTIARAIPSSKRDGEASVSNGVLKMKVAGDKVEFKPNYKDGTVDITIGEGRSALKYTAKDLKSMRDIMKDSFE